MGLLAQKRFDGDILITDPSYLMLDDAHKGDWERCEYGSNMEILGIKNYLCDFTIIGDWGCEVFSGSVNDVWKPIDPARRLGQFAADAACVIVCLMDEVLAYNPAFDLPVTKPDCAMVIPDFHGIVKFLVKKDPTKCSSLHVVGIGNKPFFSRQECWSEEFPWEDEHCEKKELEVRHPNEIVAMKAIHPFDPTTTFLDGLLPPGTDLCPQKPTNGGVRRFLISATTEDRLYLLGHGTAYGLLESSERLLVKAEHVSILRKIRTIIGVWCYAASFAEKYGLHGLFTGMIISELEEAQSLNIPAGKDEIQMENIRFVENLAQCIADYPLSEVPRAMLDKDIAHTPLTKFNYGNIFYFP